MNRYGLIGRIGKGGDHHTWISRDYLDIDCYAFGCMFNLHSKCATPSHHKIGPDGRCEGFTAPPPKPVTGD